MRPAPPAWPRSQGGSQQTFATQAQAGRARAGLSGSSPLLFPKQPARRCHTGARGCTRKPGHSPCGKEAPATTCEYCLQVMLPPSPRALSWGCLPAAQLWEGRASTRPSPSPAGSCPLPSAGWAAWHAPVAPPAVHQGRVLLKGQLHTGVTHPRGSRVGFGVCVTPREQQIPSSSWLPLHLPAEAWGALVGMGGSVVPLASLQWRHKGLAGIILWHL